PTAGIAIAPLPIPPEATLSDDNIPVVLPAVDRPPPPPRVKAERSSAMPVMLVVGVILVAVCIFVGLIGVSGFYVWRKAQMAQSARDAQWKQTRAFDQDANARAREVERQWRERDRLERLEAIRREREAAQQVEKTREQWEVEQAERDRAAENRR